MDAIQKMPIANNRVQVTHRAAYAIAILGLDIVARSTIRSMLPTGVVVSYGLSKRLSRSLRKGDRSTGGRNKTSEAFGRALRKFEQNGWIQRGRVFILVKDRAALLDYAVGWLLTLPKELANVDSQLVDVESGIQCIKSEIEDATLTEKAIMQRRQELEALMLLMKNGIGGSRWSGRGSVRAIPKTKII